TRLDRIRNEEIRTRLEIENIQNTIAKKQLAWYGHLVRMAEDSQTKLIWNSRTGKKNSRGRPQKTWENNVQEILNRNNISWQEARKLAKSRKDWKDLINRIK